MMMNGRESKYFFPFLNFFETICKRTEPELITRGIATTGRIKTESVKNANVAKVIVRPIIPVSPI